MADEQIVAQLVFEALDRASREMQKISRGLEVMGDESEETDRDLAQVADGLEEVGREGERAGKRGGMSMTDFKSTVDLMKQSVNELKQAVKQVYEFAELGAQVIQTEESFEFLREEMELGPGYLDRLSQAAGGTIPQLKLMAGVGTLAAGTSREFGAELADAYPTLVEYARAAAKLNPHLGDTSFMLDSIATGIKRGSPLILDNLGLVVKVGEANRIHAELLGKTVDQLTAEEKQMALLNDTMRAGARLVEQVGGSVESATDDFASLEAAIADTKNELAKEFVPAVADAAKKVTTWLNFHAAQDQYDQLIEKVREFDETAAEGAETRMRAVQREHGAWVSFTEQQDEIAALGGEIDTLTQLMAEQEVALGARAAAFRDSQWQTGEMTVAVKEAMEAELALRAANREVAKSMLLIGSAREAERQGLEDSTAAQRELTRAREDDGRASENWAEALEGHAEELEAQAEAQAAAAEKAAEAQVAAYKKVAEARRQAAAELGDEFTEALQAEEEATVDLAEALYAEADAAGASASTLALLAAATGDYTDEQIAAALRTAVLQEKIEEMGAAVVAEEISIRDAIEGLQNFREAMDALPDEKVVVDIEVAVAGVEADIDEAAKNAARRFALHMAADEESMSISPQVDTSEADTALDTTTEKADGLTVAVEAIPDVLIETDDATLALEETTTQAEGLKVAMEEIPTELELAITSNLPSQIQLLRQMESMIRNMPSASVGRRDDYDDDPTSLH